MLPRSHFVLGLFLSLILFILFPELGLTGFIAIWAASFLIDVDHYIYYIWLKKDWNLKNAHSWFMIQNAKAMKLTHKQRLRKIKTIPCLLHGVEALIILLALSFFHKIFLYIFIGFIFHEFLDLINAIYYGFPLGHVGSQTYNFISRRLDKKTSN